VSVPPTTVTPLASYRNDTPFPFCPGCGHGPILDKLNAALVSLELDPRQVVIVSDIGCSGLSDQYFATSAFHGLHGRSITYATGIKLARPDLKVIVVMGDGGTGIGGAHLLNAARRNIGVTVLVFNNFNFGMTGGQHSTTTPSGAVTTTTPGGNLERPLDVCATVAANGAGYVWRGTSFDEDLSARIADAIRAECFALLDVWELCTAYFVPGNKASRKTLASTLDELGLDSGLLHTSEHPEYSAAYRAAARAERERFGRTDGESAPALCSRGFEPRFAPALERPFRLVIAGSAGGKVRSAARMVGEAAMLTGLWAAQRDDYPITVMTGHSLSELVLSPDEIDYTGITRPDAMLVLSEDGLAHVGRYLSAMQPVDRLFTLPAFADTPTRAAVTVLDPARASLRLRGGRLALFCAASAVRALGIVPFEAFLLAAERNGRYAEENLETVRAAMDAWTPEAAG
jgi:pyruvate/2-oxoacid:ferredoxin oxidoreductase beta subunit/Pyruvate/2-oxoacid:ferredoxin oxidoreductase gamma subunit